MLPSRPFDPAPTLSNSTPAPLGSAAAGVGTTVSRADHVHAMPSAADVGAPALSSTLPEALGVAAIGVGTTAARADHIHPLGDTPWSGALTPTEIETNDATVTTLASLTTDASHSYVVDVTVVSTRSPTSVVAWKLLATVHSEGGGTLTLNDVLTTGPTDGGTSGMAATIDVSGSTIRVRVTGLGGSSVFWSVAGTVLALGN